MSFSSKTQEKSTGNADNSELLNILKSIQDNLLFKSFTHCSKHCSESFETPWVVLLFSSDLDFLAGGS
jgi:hypothetical protein